MLLENVYWSRVDRSNKRNKLFEKKYLLSRVDNLISAPNFYCYNFNGRAVPWAFSVGVQCMQIYDGV